jgi:hypothetical protein
MISIWSDVIKMHNKGVFRNISYDRHCKDELEPDYGVNRMRLWEECYCKWNLFSNKLYNKDAGVRCSTYININHLGAHMRLSRKKLVKNFMKKKEKIDYCVISPTISH